ncbi:MAG: serine--tRNA ligase [Anaerolineales bacterium]|jgi:seryl-tRNA synthetase
MLDIQKIRQNPKEVVLALSRRMEDPPIDQLVKLDEQRRALLTEVEQLKAERNTVSKEIGKMKDADARQEKIEAMKAVGERIDALDQQVADTEAELEQKLLELPNLPDDSVPDGADDSENVVIRQEGKIPEFDFTPKPHWDLGPELGILDFERGVKLSGSRFYILNGAGARLQRALITWMLDLHIEQGYVERYLPAVVREDIIWASGQLPKFRDNLYSDREDDLWLVPTAEVPLTGMHMDEIFEEEVLPLRYTAYTPCFRREKISAGRDVRGIKRGHQFDKVEMYTYCKPENSMDELERMRENAEETCKQLQLPYRVLDLCIGDLGFCSTKSYDIEVWAPGADEWLEVSSISNCTDFQARRAKARFRPADGGKPQLLHTLNGSGLGMPRTMIAILENYQQADGSVVVPEALRPYMGGLEVIKPEKTL